MTDAARCDEIRDVLPELAAGVAAGDDRARALRHLAGCAACRQELDELTDVLDSLVLLAPEKEPSPGFETAVLAAMSDGAPYRRRAGRLLLAAAASVVAAALAAGTVWWSTADERRVADAYQRTLAEADGEYLAAARMTSATKADVGTVFAYEGRPSWVFITVEDAPAPGRYEVQVVTTNGQTVGIGWCDVTDGRGSWGRAVDVPVNEIRRVEMLRAGLPTMSASFDRS